mmetsp:Transcript_37103/g.66395  ORF Transcript_37103/g.66395 Transcript_37103/m.66395 type:complete len:241 (+) Transcript_37103:564-1286(+)
MPSTTVSRTALLAKRPEIEKSVACVRMYEEMSDCELESVPAQPTLTVVLQMLRHARRAAALVRVLQKLQLRSCTAHETPSMQVSSGTKLSFGLASSSALERSSAHVPQPRVSHDPTTDVPLWKASTRLREVTIPVLSVSALLLLVITRGCVTKSPLYATRVSTPLGVASVSRNRAPPVSVRSSCSDSVFRLNTPTFSPEPSAARSDAAQGLRIVGSPVAEFVPDSQALASSPARYAKPTT